MKNLNLLFNKLYFKDMKLFRKSANDYYEKRNFKDFEPNRSNLYSNTGEPLYKIVNLAIIDSKEHNVALNKKKQDLQRKNKDTSNINNYIDEKSVYNNLNNRLFDCEFENNDYKESPLKDMKGYETIRLKTTYPGLLIGTGNPHDAINSDEAIKLGFSFDYTTGQPIIPGSSVKGLLRSYFREQPEAVKAIYNEEIDVAALEKAIFVDSDVFLDAVICDVVGNGGKFLSCDYITPHKDLAHPEASDEHHATKNPTPLRMLRINPNVVFEFRFILTGKDDEVEKKLKLFKAMLCIFGIGAKTNVGYGRLTEDLNAVEKHTEPPVQNNNQYNNGGHHNNGNNNNHHNNGNNNNHYNNGNNNNRNNNGNRNNQNSGNNRGGYRR